MRWVPYIGSLYLVSTVAQVRPASTEAVCCWLLRPTGSDELRLRLLQVCTRDAVSCLCPRVSLTPACPALVTKHPAVAQVACECCKPQFWYNICGHICRYEDQRIRFNILVPGRVYSDGFPHRMGDLGHEYVRACTCLMHSPPIPLPLCVMVMLSDPLCLVQAHAVVLIPCQFRAGIASGTTLIISERVCCACSIRT